MIKKERISNITKLIKPKVEAALPSDQQVPPSAVELMCYDLIRAIEERNEIIYQLHCLECPELDPNKADFLCDSLTCNDHWYEFLDKYIGPRPQGIHKTCASCGSWNGEHCEMDFPKHKHRNDPDRSCNCWEAA